MNRHTFYLEQAARCSERSRKVRDPRRRQLLMMERQDWLALAHRLERACAASTQTKLSALVALQRQASPERLSEATAAKPHPACGPARGAVIPPGAEASLG